MFQQFCISPFCVGLGGLAGPAALRRGAAQDAQKGGAQAAGVRAAGGQNLEGRPLAAQEEPQQQVTGADGGGAQPGPFGGGPLHGAPAPGRQALAGPPSGGAGPSQPGHLLPEVLGAQPGAPEGPPGRPLSLPDQAQQQVLGPHIAVPQPCGGVLGQLQGRLGPWGKSGFADDGSPRSFVCCAGGGDRRAWGRLWGAPSSSGVRAPANSAS